LAQRERTVSRTVFCSTTTILPAPQVTFRFDYHQKSIRPCNKSDLFSSVEDRPTLCQHVLRAAAPRESGSRLEVVYDDVALVLRGLMTVPTGAIVALLGANGAGKTTLLRTITGLLVPHAAERSATLPPVFRRLPGRAGETSAVNHSGRRLALGTGVVGGVPTRSTTPDRR
jgi:ABC-type ATPase with predicted acetyltransferase domain